MNQTVSLADTTFFGDNLVRPECVLTTSDGHVYVSNFDGGVTGIAPDGRRTHYLSSGYKVKTNGFAIAPGGDFLLADLGEAGGIWRLARTGELTRFLGEIEGAAIPPANFVSIDAHGRVWITISTTTVPRHHAYRADVRDGFIIMVGKDGARIAADGLGYTNEAHLDPSGRWLYANETFARRLSRFPVDNAARLGRRQTVWEFGPGEFPDGLWFDQDGGVMVTTIVGNKVIRVRPGSDARIILSETDAGHVAWVEEAFQAGIMGRAHLDRTPARRLRNISSIAFGGRDLKTAYMGCLLDRRIVRFQSPVAGVRPPHWDWA